MEKAGHTYKLKKQQPLFGETVSFQSFCFSSNSYKSKCFYFILFQRR